MADARNIVTWALQELGVLAAGETAVAADALDALAALNAVVDQFATERLAVYKITRTTFSVTATQNYTVGTGATINVARPTLVDHVSVYTTADSISTETPLEPFTPDEWHALSQKGLTSDRPTRYYYDPTFASGFATLRLWPVPTGSTLTGVLYAGEPVAEFTNLSTAVSLPPGYRRMLVKNLAIELAPQYQVPVSPDLRAQAADAMAAVKRSNVRLNEMTFEGIFQTCGAGPDFETGE